MFFKTNPLKLKIQEAKDLVRLGKKVFNYRQDILPQNDINDLNAAIDALKFDISHSPSLPKIDASYQKLDKIMTKTGGHIYPVKFIPDNCEVILVAAILALGIRTFFFQPFSIPTNSMYPTFNGLTSAVYSDSAQPSLSQRIFNTVTLGASHYTIEAPANGEVLIPISQLHGRVQFDQVTGTKWFIVPTPKRQYTLLVDNSPTSFTVPFDFNIEDVIHKTFFPQFKNFREVLLSSISSGNFTKANGHIFLKTNKFLKKGETLLNFDILAGDMLFVNRFCYHFSAPKIGDPFVFRTTNIPNFPEDKYFIKRLVGIPGDTLEVKEPVLFRNGQPIEGSKSFQLNAERIGEYEGYTAERALSPGHKINVQPHHFYAMGDNSDNSADSRHWGQVPEKEVIGKAAFIFYPFSHRWGIAR